MPTHSTSLTPSWHPDQVGYATPQAFADDVRQVFANCRRYNAPDQEVVVMGNTLEVGQSQLRLPCTALKRAGHGLGYGVWCSPTLCVA